MDEKLKEVYLEEFKDIVCCKGESCNLDGRYCGTCPIRIYCSEVGSLLSEVALNWIEENK